MDPLIVTDLKLDRKSVILLTRLWSRKWLSFFVNDPPGAGAGLISETFCMTVLDERRTEDDQTKTTESLPSLQGQACSGDRTSGVHGRGIGRVFRCSSKELQGEQLEAEKLHAKLGQLTMENDFLSKVLGHDR